MADMDLFIGHPACINQSVYGLWLQGNSLEKAVAARQSRGFASHNASAIHSDTIDQYQVFAMLEHYLKHPQQLASQSLVPLGSDLQHMLIERYFDFDEAVMRELLGKKLTAGLRKVLDDVSERSKINLQSCRRQFDNLKRIYKAVEDTEGGLAENVQNAFLLSRDMSNMYARIVFVCANKLEVSKKRVAHLAFSDIVQCAGVMMALWTPVGAAPGVQLDPVFLQELRDLKFLLNNDRDVLAEHRALVAAELAAHGDTFKTLHAHFKGVARACLAIGAGLSQPKEFRDVFVDVVGQSRRSASRT
eukprot:Opistho-2@69927